MSLVPGPVARFPSDRYGRSTAVPGSKTVSMWPMRSSRGPSPVDSAHHDVPEAWPIALRLVGNALHVRAEATERIGHERGDLVHPVGGVRAAVDVHHPLKLGEVGGEAALHDAPQRG